MMGLSERQLKALGYHRQGMTLEQIGEEMGISKSRAWQILKMAKRIDRHIRHISFEDDLYMMISDTVSKAAASRIEEMLYDKNITTIKALSECSIHDFDCACGTGKRTRQEMEKLIYTARVRTSIAKKR